MIFFFEKRAKTWWILGPGENREQWARIGEEGRIAFYEPCGKLSTRGKYNTYLKARNMLKKKGFKKVQAIDLKKLTPPHVD